MRILKRIILVMLAMSLLAGAGCRQAGMSDSTTREQSAQASDSSDLTNTSQQPLEKIVIELPEEKKSDIQKISEALADGKIDKKTAVLLTIQAVHQKGNLPDEYRSDEGEDFPENLMAEYHWICNNFRTLTDDEKTSLEPYILPPDNENSFFNPTNQVNKVSLDDVINFFLGTKKVAAADNNWKEIQFSAPGKPIAAIIHYYSDSSDPDDPDDLLEYEAKLVEKAFTDSWPRFKELLQIEPTQTIQVYVGIANLGEGVLGITLPATYTVMLAPAMEERVLKATAAHELFHCFQTAMGLAEGDIEDDRLWLLDATAVWSENFIYSDYNTEHQSLPRFFHNLDNRLISGFKRYGGYIFFYFLDAYLQDKSSVPNALKKAKTMSVSYILPELVADFNAAYYLFAGYNYNAVPMKFYTDTPPFPDVSPDKVTSFIDSAASYDIPVSLEEGAMRYDLLDFTDDVNAIVDIEFKFAAFEEKEYGRRALIKVAGEWHEEDWSGINRRKFCRNEPSENVEQIVLIHSVANLKGSLGYTYYLLTSDACDNSFNGNIKITVNLTGPANIRFKTDYITREEVKFDADENCYIVKKRQIDYSEASGLDTKFIVGPEWNEIDLGAIGSSFYATGHLYEEYETEVYRKITGNAEDGYTILLNPDTNNKAWVTTISRMMFLGATSVQMAKTDGMNLYFNNIEVKPEEINGKRLQGTRTMILTGVYASGTGTLEFDYKLP